VTAASATTIPVHYVIADGVEVMEGNGAFHGLARHLGRLVFADAPSPPIQPAAP
jgi:uncharacterized protein (DUF362 family)